VAGWLDMNGTDWLPRLLAGLWWWLQGRGQTVASHEYAAAMSASEIVSVAVALTALVVSCTSLWLTVLRPARLSLTYMSEHTRIGQGGKNEVPNICTIRAFIALTNAGARAGLLERIVFDGHFKVSPSSALQFAVDARDRAGRPSGTMFRLDGKVLKWPKTVEAGDVRALELDFEMGGDLLRAREEGREDLRPIAELVAELERISISVYATYRTGRGLRFPGYLWSQRIESGSVYIPGAHLRRQAIEYWSEIGRDDLAQIVSDSFTGRDIDKL
jgi:hypothetical protein